MCFSSLIKLIFEPTRRPYTEDILYPAIVASNYTFESFETIWNTTKDGKSVEQVLQCSFYRYKQDIQMQRPCLIYLHPNSATRLEVITTKAYEFSTAAQCHLCR